MQRGSSPRITDGHCPMSNGLEALNNEHFRKCSCSMAIFRMFIVQCLKSIGHWAVAISDFVLLESTVHASPAQRNDHASWPSDGADSPFGRHVSTGVAFPRPGVLREGRPCPA